MKSTTTRKIFLNKIWTILKSRFQKEEEDPIVEAKRKICLKCEYNSFNREDFTLKDRLIKFFSDLYTVVTFSEYKDFGICICNCPVFYLTKSDSECTAKERFGDDKWVSIIPKRNSKKTAR